MREGGTMTLFTAEALRIEVLLVKQLSLAVAGFDVSMLPLFRAGHSTAAQC